MSKVLFRERLFPGPGIHLALMLSAPMVYLAALPISEVLALALGILVPAALIAVVNLRAPSVVLTDQMLSAGPMQIPLRAIGTVEVFSGEPARVQRGPSLSANSQLLFRGDVDSLVKIEIVDSEDPTDFVLISTRRAEALAVALGANRS